MNLSSLIHIHLSFNLKLSSPSIYSLWIFAEFKSLNSNRWIAVILIINYLISIEAIRLINNLFCSLQIFIARFETIWNDFEAAWKLSASAIRQPVSALEADVKVATSRLSVTCCRNFEILLVLSGASNSASRSRSEVTQKSLRSPTANRRSSSLPNLAILALKFNAATEHTARLWQSLISLICPVSHTFRHSLKQPRSSAKMMKREPIARCWM